MLWNPLIGRVTARTGGRSVALVTFPHVVDHRVDDGEVVILGVRDTSRRPLP